MNMRLLESVQERDDAFLLRLYESVRQEEIAAWGWSAQQQQSFLTMQFQAQQQSYARHYPHSKIRIVQMNGESVGKLHSDRSDTKWVLIDIALLPNYRNAGVGTKLIEDIKEDAAAHGMPIQLHVWHDNPAQRLYQRAGFKTICSNELYHTMEWSCSKEVCEKPEPKGV